MQTLPQEGTSQKADGGCAVIDQHARAEQVVIERAREDPALFGRYVWGYKAAAHHRRWLELLQSGADRIIICAPPGHAKTIWVSQIWASWWAGNNPDKHVIIASVTDAVAVQITAAIKQRMEDSQRWLRVFPGAQPDKRRDWADSHWSFTAKRSGDKDPSCAGCGIGGSVISRRGDLILFDDPAKGEESVATQHLRDRAWRDFTTLLETRLTPGGIVAVIGTRWHTDDVIGRCLKSGLWKRAIFPAVSELGEALWPEHYPLMVLEDRRKRMSTNDWLCLYQCSPVAPGGNILKEQWLGLWDNAPPFKHVICIWDFALKKTERGSFSACIVFAADHENRWYVCDAWRGRGEWPEIRVQVARIIAEWRPAAVLIEETQMGLVALAEMRAQTNIPTIAVHPGKDDKESRLSAVALHCEAGKVKIKGGEIWTRDLIDELVSFPASAYNDWVDCFAYGLKHLAAHTRGGSMSGIALGGRSEAASMGR